MMLSMNLFPRQTDLHQSFSAVVLMFWARQLFFVGSVLHVIECLAASLACTT